MSPRRVKRALNEIESDGGIVLAIARNPALGSGVSFYVKIYWDDREADVKELVELIGEEFPVETWESYISASDSVLYTRFFVEHMKNVESISNRLSQFEAIKKLETLVFYPARISSVMTRDCLLDDICKAGYDIFGD